MGCDFDPEIALRELGEEGVAEILKNRKANCPAEHLSGKECIGHCECCPPPIKEKKKQMIEIPNNDTRIPHSLDIEPRKENEFHAEKYQEDLKEEIPRKIEEVVKKVNKMEDTEEFPEIPKVLTYSNLKLDYDENDNQKEHSVEEDQQQPIPIFKKQSSKTSENVEIDFNKRNKMAESRESSHPFAEDKEEKISRDLFTEFYGQDNNFHKSQPKIDKKENHVPSKSYLEEENVNKLSRVINIDEEMERENRRGPLPHFEEPRKQNTEHLQIRREVMGLPKNTVKSNLLLNLYVEVDQMSIVLPRKEGFTIVYRPYGQKDRLTLGPNFTNLISILSAVGEGEVKKMGKVPFILEFWGANDNKFLGLIKLNLAKIKNGFILNDRLNEIAIKTNILPTTISRGQIQIKNLEDQPIGSCSLYAAIGTSTQISTYLNQNDGSKLKEKVLPEPPHIEQIEDPEKHVENGIEKEIDCELDTKNRLVTFDKFLCQIYKNNNKVIDTLNMFMNQPLITKKEITTLANSIDVSTPEINSVYTLLLEIQQEQKVLQSGNTNLNASKNKIDFRVIAESFDDYIEILQFMGEDFGKSVQEVRSAIRDHVDVINMLRAQTPTQVISKTQAVQILQKNTLPKYSNSIIELFEKLNQFINISYLEKVLQKANLVSLPELSQISFRYINELIKRKIEKELKRVGESINVEQFLANFEDRDWVTGVELYKLLAHLGAKISLWAVLHWVESANENLGLGQDGINVLRLGEYYGELIIKEHEKENNILDGNNNESQKEHQHSNIKQEEEPSNEKSEEHLSQENKPNHENQHSIDFNQDLKPQSQLKFEGSLEPHQSMDKIDNLHKHLFTINPTELTLDHPLSGNCTVIYEFPFDEEQIKSRTFQTSLDKHKYQLKMYGTHGFTIEEKASDYLADNALKFWVKIDNKIEFSGALAVDELLIEANTEEDKIIPLFGERGMNVAGKIRLTLGYESVVAKENMLGKETTYQLFLPKSGYINFGISCQLQSSKVRSQLNIREEFYIALVLDIFHNNSSLKSLFPVLSSPLYSDSAQTANLSGSIKLSLSSIILDYIKTNHARLSLNIIYYSKESGNFQRKEVPYAIIEIPLVNVIRSEGIKGDYAFKNKLGMYVTLAACEFKYEKNSVKNSIANVNSKGEKGPHVWYWLILNFLEFINFEDRKLKWVKMEFVLKGKKYGTEKVHVEEFSVNNLNNSSIMLKLTEEDFFDTKVIPITILSNLSEKLAIDISLKSISKELHNQRYSIHNQYYVVVNQESKAKKMRLGVKSYCFKGGNAMGNFVSCLCEHLDTEVFDEMQLPEDMENYEEMVSIFKDKTKLSNKALQEMISELNGTNLKEKLNFLFFTNRTYYKLDFTPILAQNESEIEFICEELPTEVSKQEILDYLSQQKIKLINFRSEFLDRFCFKELNRAKTDKNVEFLGIDNQIDLISFVRKIKLLDNKSYEESYLNQSNLQETMVEICILEGSDFNQLYNGIKPNSIVRIPDFGIQSQLSHRNANPYFNEAFQVAIEKENLQSLKKIKIEVYHCSTDDEDAENILIGEGFLSLSLSDIKGYDKIIKVTLNSIMTNRNRAHLNIKIGFGESERWKNKEESKYMSQKMDDSADVSRLGEIIHDIHQEMKYKDKLFESSDEDC